MSARVGQFSPCANLWSCRHQERANARVNVSESIPGNPERILSVSGPLETVSKVSEEMSQLSFRMAETLPLGIRTDRS